MKLALVLAHAANHPDVPSLRALLDSRDFVELSTKPLGAISRVPCIAALDDNGFAQYSGGTELNSDTLDTWAAASGAVEVVLPPLRTISRVRFDNAFATAIGEVAYDDVLDLLATIAATDPKTEDSIKVKRALRGLDNPPGIDYPKSPWRTPADDDLTASFLKLVHDVLVEDVSDIADKIDAGLAAWPKI